MRRIFLLALVLLATPALGQNYVAPTPPAGDNSNRIATTAFVNTFVGTLSPVLSVFGRIGAVVATTGDYAFSQISGTAAATQGGTGVASPTAHGLAVAEGSSPFVSVTGAAGTVLGGNGTGADPSFTRHPSVGGAGVGAGAFDFNGVTSGTITITPGAGAAGTYNFFLPSSAGSSGQPLLSGGGGATQTYGTLGVAGGGTGAVTLTAHGVLIGETTSAVVASTAGAAGTILSGNGASDPTFTPTLILGANGGTQGSITLNGSATGSVILVPQASAGTPTVTFGTSSGTPAVVATAPLSIAPITGNVTCATCATTTNGGAITGTAPVAVSAGGAISVTTPLTSGFRLTLTTATPYLTGNTAAIGTVFLTPATSNVIPLWNGSAWIPTVCAETSNVLANSAVGNAGPAAAVANSVYDLYVWSNSGTCTLTRSPAWTTVNSRGSGAGTAEQTRINGVLTNNQAITNGPAAQTGTYVGTAETDAGGVTVTMNFSVTGAPATSAAHLGLWNEYNRIPTRCQAADTTASWTYSTNAIRAVDNQAVNRCEYVIGEAGESGMIDARSELYTAAPAAAGSLFSIGLSQDATNTTDGGSRFLDGSAAVFAINQVAQFLYGSNTQVAGQHFISGTERGDGTNSFTLNQVLQYYLNVQLMM